MKHHLFIASCLVGFLYLPYAQATAIQSPSTSQNVADFWSSLDKAVTLTSNYLSHGQSLSGDGPAVQGQLELVTASGFYGGLWGSTTEINNTRGLELDFYLGQAFHFKTHYSLLTSIQTAQFFGDGNDNTRLNLIGLYQVDANEYHLSLLNHLDTDLVFIGLGTLQQVQPNLYWRLSAEWDAAAPANREKKDNGRLGIKHKFDAFWAGLDMTKTSNQSGLAVYISRRF